MKQRLYNLSKLGIILAVLLIALIGCKAGTEGNANIPDQAVGEPDTNDSNSDSKDLPSDQQQSPDSDEPSTADHNQEQESDPLTSPFSDSLLQGKIEGLPFSLGDDASKIVQTLGEPEASDVWGGSYYFSYPQFVVFTDSSQSSTDGIIAMISINNEYPHPIEGVTIGQTFADIQALLGNGYIEHKDTEEEFVLMYQVGEHLLVFVADDEDGPTTRVEFFGWKELL